MIPTNLRRSEASRIAPPQRATTSPPTFAVAIRESAMPDAECVLRLQAPAGRSVSQTCALSSRFAIGGAARTHKGHFMRANIVLLGACFCFAPGCSNDDTGNPGTDASAGAHLTTAWQDNRR